MNKNKVIATWSGGKDSAFAMYKAQQLGYSVSAIANTISQEYRRVRFHGLEARMIEMQAVALELPLLQAETTAENYKEEFIANLKRGITDEVSGVVFGDIHLEDCLLWAKEVCDELGVKALEPHWGNDPQQIVRDFIATGFEAVIVSTQANVLGKEWIGRRIDAAFLDDISKLPAIDPCGENGEYHSYVLNGPLFTKRIMLEEVEKIERGGYYFLDIQKSTLVSK